MKTMKILSEYVVRLNNWETFATNNTLLETKLSNIGNTVETVVYEKQSPDSKRKILNKYREYQGYVFNK